MEPTPIVSATTVSAPLTPPSIVPRFLQPYVRNFPRAAWLHVATGFACGAVLGVPPMLIYFQSILSNCGLARTETECAGVAPHTCQWDATHAMCLGSSSVCDAAAWSSAECLQAPLCSFSAHRSQCEQLQGFGWSDSQMGFVASSIAVGAMIGSYVASATEAGANQLKMLNHCGVCVVAGGVVGWLCWTVFAHNWILTGLWFLVAGVGFGGFISLSPVCVSSVVAAEAVSFTGAMFELSIVSGICLAAFIALVASDSASAASHCLYFFVAATGGVSFYVSEYFFAPIYLEAHPSVDIIAAAKVVRSPSQQQQQKHDQQQVRQEAEADSPLPSSSSSPSDASAAVDTQQPQQQQQEESLSTELVVVKRRNELIQICYVCGFFLATGFQLTGINAIMSYAPKITSAAGISQPLVGNFIIMLWNALSCLPSVALGAKYSASSLYLVGVGVGSTFCFLTAGAMLLENAVLALICVCGSIFAFEGCQAPMYYSLVTEIFPPEVRSAASARINLINFAWNIVVNALYPSLCAAWMPVGDPAGGVRRVFMLFGSLGFGCLGALYLLFPKTFLNAHVRQSARCESK